MNWGHYYIYMDFEIKQKNYKMESLQNKKRLPASKVTEGMNKPGLNKISAKRKGDRIMDR